MVSQVHNSENKHATAVRLSVRRTDGQEFFYDLEADNAVIAGSDRTCSLHLDGEKIGALHAMIRYENGTIYVKDWYSESGTFVNNLRIETETTLPEDGEVRIGDYTLRVTNTISRPVEPTETNSELSANTSDNPTPAVEQGNEVPQTTSSALPDEVAEESTSAHEDPDIENITNVDPETDSPTFDLDDIPAFEDDPVSDWGDDFQATENCRDHENQCDPETFALMREELEHLQSELAERDARLAEMASLIDDTPQQTAEQSTEDSSETAALVDRLEQLLDELSQSDERMATMEELLRHAEEAQRADQEERKQIDAWITDIEDRLGEREAEWQAEIDLLKEQVEQLTAERDRAEQANASKHAQQEYQKMIRQLRDHATKLQAQLKDAQSARQELESRLEQLDEQNSAEMIQQKVDEALREERLKYAQEQSALAQERAEVSRMKLELQGQSTQQRAKGTDIDSKVRAFRDHLKEIHEQEKEQRKERSLSSRLSSLWKRLEGRS
ncbi:MAG: hypothetical protein Tsb009_31190 [Planctomycetaceae bacterium]